MSAPLLTTAQAAPWFGVTPATVRAWARSGRLPSVVTGKGRRYDAALVALMAGRVLTGGEPAMAGRDHPRPAVPGAAACDVRYEPLDGGRTRARCAPCGWQAVYEPGHDEADWQRLELMHAGRTP